jgi:hypothetical protein
LASMPANRITISTDAAELIRRLRDDRFLREPIRAALVNIGRHGENAAKLRAPVDKGRLRASITHEVDDQPLMLDVRIGVIGVTGDLKYAKYMEYGTGTKHDHPNWPRSRHVVTGGQLMNWGPAKVGLANPYAAARIITRRGGLMPRRYLRSVLEDHGDQYVRIVRAYIRRAVSGG